MSTFNGFIKEIPSIRVDFFDDSKDVTLFFLSHCHTDHMVGIQRLVNVKNAKLVLSEVSLAIVGQLYPDLKPLLEPIEIWNDKLYTLDEGTKLLVHAVPAGHCPGSVMFYFQTEAVNVLYTGDFRFRIKDLQQLKILQTIKRDLKAVYVDSTFLLPEFDAFPDQRDSVSVVAKIIKTWIEDSKDNRVFIEIPARFGSEFLILELFKKLRMRMFITDVDHSCLLPFIPEIRNLMEARLNDLVKIVIGRRNGELLDPRFQWRIIRPSAMYWTNFKQGDKIAKKDPFKKNLYRVCYSSHSSRSEIIEFLKLLNAEEINLNVLPEGAKDRRFKELDVFKRKVEERPQEEENQTIESPSKYAFVASNIVSIACDKYKKILEQLRQDDLDSDEEEEVVTLPLPKRARVD